METMQKEREYKASAAKPIKRFLPVALTPDEIHEAGRKLVGLMAEHDRKKHELSEITKLRREELKNLTGEIGRFRKMVHTETETREVECVERFDFDVKKVVLARTDTGEVVQERDMTDPELQLKFKFDSDRPEPIVPEPPELPPAAREKRGKGTHAHLPPAQAS